MVSYYCDFIIETDSQAVIAMVLHQHFQHIFFRRNYQPSGLQELVWTPRTGLVVLSNIFLVKLTYVYRLVYVCKLDFELFLLCKIKYTMFIKKNIMMKSTITTIFMFETLS